jgi:mannose-6-phosphate isomerase-like protein (cupin superfamily)
LKWYKEWEQVKREFNMKCIMALTLAVLFVFSASAQPLPEYYQLDPKSYDPAVDVNTDLFVNHWRDSPPISLHGDLIVRDMFVPLRGDTLEPAEKGAVLTLLKRVSRFSLDPGAGSTDIVPRGEQEIYFITGGTGELRTEGDVHFLYPEVGILIPEGVKASINNTGQTDLVGYLWVEPTPTGFEPKSQVTVRDTNALPIEGPPGHWANYHRDIIRPEDGLAVLLDVHQTILHPMSISQFHASRPVGTDVIWIALEGDIYTLL